MFISLLPHFFFISILVICTTNSNHAHAYKQCMLDQKTLLLDLKNELKFDSSYSQKLVHWNQTDNYCGWEGVECDVAGHVIGLQLDFENIYGGLESSSSLFNLRYLKTLNLAWNGFNGHQIPRAIGNLTYLTHLDLSGADFGGQIPIELSLLTRLVSLDLSINNYYYALKLEYPNLRMVLRNLTGLQQLYLNGVDISGEKSEWYNIISSSLPNLRELSLSNCGLSSPSDPSLLQFHSLTLLRLSGNNLSTVVPNFFVNFSSLTFLSLSNCSLKGPLDLSNNFFFGSNSSMFPPPLSNLSVLNFKSNIKFLYLRSNQLEGPIPESFFQLESIRVLVLSDNLFNGTFQLEKIQRLPNLTALALSDNKYLTVDASSTNSSVSIYPPLRSLLLASCNLYSFPDFLKQSTTLRFLDLSNNRIAGEIPSWIWDIGNGTVLYRLNLSCNLLVDFQKPYKTPSSLLSLDLHSNQLQGELPLPFQPGEFGGYVDYSNNNFDGPIPPNIGNFTSSLYFFSLKNNSLSGSIPPSLCNSLSLHVLDLSLNKLTGTIPPCLCNSLSLEVLDLSLNKLTGTIPPCLLDNMKYLQVLNLGRNNISGEIPDKFSVKCGLKTLELSDNYLGGNIPSSLGNCKFLKVLNVGNNNINDTFPCMLWSSLLILVLRSNRFYGEVGCNNTWPNLQIIDIASNNFSGNLHPKSFSSWRGMMAVGDTLLGRNRSDFKVLQSNPYYQNEVTLTIKGVELKLVKIWPNFISIDFSCNNFKGEIPEAIGDLTSLYLLNLSHNALSGAIPKSLGKLRELGSLDLSKNELRGMIPMELAGLTFLQVMNLSYNKLVGEIPVGPQLQTFSSDSFEGNRGLCGKPINISCRNSTEPGTMELEEKMDEIEWEYVSVVPGYVVGLGSFVWVLFGCISFREMYFYKIDEILEKIFKRHNRRRRRHGRRSVRRNQVRRR